MTVDPNPRTQIPVLPRADSGTTMADLLSAEFPLAPLTQGRERTELVFSSELNVSQPELWDLISTPDGANYELGPLFRMTFPRDAPDLAPELTQFKPLHRCWMLFLGFIPVDISHFTLLHVEDGRGYLERSPMTVFRLWQHERTIDPVPGGARLTDRLTFEPVGSSAVSRWMVRRPVVFGVATDPFPIERLTRLLRTLGCSHELAAKGDYAVRRELLRLGFHRSAGGPGISLCRRWGHSLSGLAGSASGAGLAKGDQSSRPGPPGGGRSRAGYAQHGSLGHGRDPAVLGSSLFLRRPQYGRDPRIRACPRVEIIGFAPARSADRRGLPFASGQRWVLESSSSRDAGFGAPRRSREVGRYSAPIACAS